MTDQLDKTQTIRSKEPRMPGAPPCGVVPGTFTPSLGDVGHRENDTKRDH
jgi:hypothetical protein